MNPPVRNPTFREIVFALERASVFVICSHFESYRICLPMSLAGALALKHWKIKAQVIPCAVGVFQRANFAGPTLTLGFTPQQVYSKFAPPTISFEEWHLANGNLLPEIAQNEPFHLVIEAKHKNERALIDLTLGQLRTLATEAKSVPLYLSSFHPGWPAFETQDWSGRYFKYPHGSEAQSKLEALIVEQKTDGLQIIVEDLIELMSVSLALHNNEAAFYEAVQRNEPAEFNQVLERVRQIS